MKGVSAKRGIERLTDRTIRSWLRDDDGTGKLSDGAGLYLKRLPSGRGAWRTNYVWNGKARTYAIGVYPEIGLAEARKERRRVKKLLAEGKEPTLTKHVAVAKSRESADSTLAVLAEDWLKIRKADWSAIHYKQSRQSLQKEVLDTLGKVPVSEITAAMIARTVRPLVKRSQDRAQKVLQHVAGIFRLAQARGFVRENPALPVREEFPRRRVKGKRPAFLTFAELGEVLRVWNAAPMTPAVRLCHRLIAYTSVRLSNAIAAEWKEFDLDADDPSWTIPRSKMKMRDRTHDHRVLLSPTIVTELRTWQSMTGGKGLLFQSPTGRGMLSLEALSKQMRTLGFGDRHSVHGWRASFSTLARDNDFSRDVVELTLDHIHDNEVARAYDRGQRLEERRRLAYWWDSMLSAAERGVEPLARSA